jgi:hypothetical protein
MHYSDGNESQAGDVVQIDFKYRGTVVACIDSNEYLHGYEHCSYLKHGIMVNTDFGGLVHYTSEATDELVLLHRTAST